MSTIQPLEAFSRQKLKGNPVLLIFTANWCSKCGALDRGTLTRMKKTSPHIVMVKVDITPDPGDALYWVYADPLGVKGLPLIVGFNSTGDRVGYVSGYYPKRVRELGVSISQ
ncbi:MAG: thioredoxin fold domain-containing protein [Candidatus Ranarchaeia archaeon]